MFGTNSIIGKKQFKEAPTDSLMVTSIFSTLQGEGPFAGLPAVFVRLSLCNLACNFCDTFFDDGDWLTYQQLEEKIENSVKSHWVDKGQAVPSWAINTSGTGKKYPNLVLVMTGGEPLLQENITEFMRQQLFNFKAVQVESNGIPDTEVPEGVVLVCSPKCAEKNGVAVKYLAPSKTTLERADCLKFVMTADENSPYNTIPQWALDWKERTGKDVYCSPMNVYNALPQKIKLLRAEKGAITLAERSTVDEKIWFFEPGLINMETAAANHEWVGHYCMEHGLKMQMQMHLFANLA